MVNRKEIKKLAKEQINNKLGPIFICLIIIYVLIYLSSFLIIGPLLLQAVFSLSMAMIWLNIAKGGTPEIQNIFDGFKDKGFERSIILYLLMYIRVLLWTLLFIIPGIIKAYSYSMSYYILAENKDMTPIEALKESERIMKGHKFDLFVLDLSFILWELLIPLTFGLILVYLIPYQEMARINFYNSIKNKEENNTAA